MKCFFYLNKRYVRELGRIMVKLKLYMNKLMTWFDYVYYRVYIAYQKRKDPDPCIYARAIVTLVQCMNFFIPMVILEDIFQLYTLPETKKAKPFLIIFMLIILVLNYRRYKIKNFEKLNKIWSDESKRVRRIRGWLVMIYILLSVLFPVIYGFIKHNIIGGKSFFIH